MTAQLSLARQKAIVLDHEAIADFYAKAHPSFPHRDEFLELIREAHVAFAAGCSRASMITAGESLLRAVYVKLTFIAADRARRGQGLAFKDTNGNEVSLTFELLQEPDDKLGFCNALEALKQNGRLGKAFIDKLYDIKGLRNTAAHGQFPLLDSWYAPDDPRPEEKFKEMISAVASKEWEFPEGYRFKFKGRRRWTTFACRDHTCGSLKPLPWLDRYAAIQLVFVQEALTAL